MRSWRTPAFRTESIKGMGMRPVKSPGGSVPEELPNGPDPELAGNIKISAMNGACHAEIFAALNF